MQEILRRAAGIRLAVFDVDGVLTDGNLILGADGDEFKVFHVRDGQGLVMLRECGIQAAVISARESRAVSDRMQALGIEYVFLGRDDKHAALAELVARLRLRPDQAAYVGDDVLDLPAMAAAGLAITVADAHPLVRKRAHWVTQSPGGRGAVREVCELLLRAQDRLDDFHNRYLKPRN